LQETSLGHEFEVSEGLGHPLNGRTSTSSIRMADAADQVSTRWLECDWKVMGNVAALLALLVILIGMILLTCIDHGSFCLQVPSGGASFMRFRSMLLALLHNRKNEGKSAEDAHKALEDYRWKTSEFGQTTHASSNLPLARLGHWLHWSSGGVQARQLPPYECALLQHMKHHVNLGQFEGHLRRPRERKKIMPRDALGRFVEICGSHLARHMCFYTALCCCTALEHIHEG
jgi:hypothetical protein